jgi:NAD(P)H-flavin reductase
VFSSVPVLPPVTSVAPAEWTYTVAARERVSPDNYRLRLSSALPALLTTACQHVKVHVRDAAGTVTCVRSYTPVACPSSTSMDLLFKHYHGGPGSSYLAELTVGASLTLSGPFGRFDYRCALHAHHRPPNTTTTCAHFVVLTIDIVPQRFQ